MGSTDSKLNFRKAVIQLTTKTQPVEATDDAFWDQFWADSTTTVQDVFALVPAAEIRALREESPSNLATLCYKVNTTCRLLALPDFLETASRIIASEQCHGLRCGSHLPPPAFFSTS
ncbi:protein HID1-like [Hippocampus comes]|uniref:protein HID1-like n=1 Tax=Hippocampus comes TaxID=109280 RepID=UPI00094E3A37|nr:PREDICTED: protein HID1-like [Hippocampus comes]